jgi:hypothetical protein
VGYLKRINLTIVMGEKLPLGQVINVVTGCENIFICAMKPV